MPAQFLRASTPRTLTRRSSFCTWGPRRVDNGAYSYTNRVQGKLDSFFGEETISRGGTKLYELHYGGGLVR